MKIDRDSQQYKSNMRKRCRKLEKMGFQLRNSNDDSQVEIFIGNSTEYVLVDFSGTDEKYFLQKAISDAYTVSFNRGKASIRGEIKTVLDIHGHIEEYTGR